MEEQKQRIKGEREADCASANLDTLVGSSESTSGGS